MALDEKRYKEIAPELSEAVSLVDVQKVKVPKRDHKPLGPLTKAKKRAIFAEFKDLAATGEPVKPFNKIAAEIKVPIRQVLKLWKEFKRVLAALEEKDEAPPVVEEING